MECWHFKDGSLSPSLSLWSQQDYELKLFHLMQQGRTYMRAIVCYHCCLNGLCVQFIILLDTQVLSCVYDFMCFIFIMRFANSLDVALSGYQCNLVSLFSSETDSAVGLKPGECFNYNHSITTLCFKVKEVDYHKGSCPQ